MILVGLRGEIEVDPSKQEGTSRKLLDVDRMRAASFQAQALLR